MIGKPISTSSTTLEGANCYINTVVCDNGNIYEIVFNCDSGKFASPELVYDHVSELEKRDNQ